MYEQIAFYLFSVLSVILFLITVMSKNVLYAEGFTLTMHFNEAMNNASDDPAFSEIKNTAIALQLIKHLATS